jgi:hypothetical protein
MDAHLSLKYYCVSCSHILKRDSFTTCDCCDVPIINGGDCGEICKGCESEDDIKDEDVVIFNYNNTKYKVCGECVLKLLDNEENFNDINFKLPELREVLQFLRTFY